MHYLEGHLPMPSSNQYHRWTILTTPHRLVIKLGNGTDVVLDVYPPPFLTQSTSYRTSSNVDNIPVIPAVVHFHGGGLSVGNKESFIPSWLIDRIISLGYTFISPNYQLIPPATAHDINQDAIDVFSFITKTVFQTKSEKTGNWQKFRVDGDKIAVSGSSAGGLVAYLAASNAVPRPKVLLSIYGMGGNFLTPFYIRPKSKPFMHDEPLLDPKDFEEHLYPFSNGPLAPCSDILIPSPPTPPPKTARMKLLSLYLQLGVFLDYYTGSHEPSLSRALQSKLEGVKDSNRARGQTAERSDPHADAQGANVTETLAQLISEEHKHIFPQLQAQKQAHYYSQTGSSSNDIPKDSGSKSQSSSSQAGSDAPSKGQGWPATVFIHGTADQSVLFSETTYMRDILLGKGMPKDKVLLLEAEGQDHGFDYAPGVETVWGGMFDEAIEFMKRELEG
ncbi:Alpha/Beta hydrolase protein [Panaeolus papilionaceus]|nr:Alpha/Beta hydrolase protein [Panaeolus papilionaceus]